MLVKILFVIFIIWVLIKLLKFIGKKVFLIIVLSLLFAYAAFSQSSDTLITKKSTSEHLFSEVKKFTNSKDFKVVKEKTETIAKTIGKVSATIYYLGLEGWNESKKKKK